MPRETGTVRGTGTSTPVSLRTKWWGFRAALDACLGAPEDPRGAPRRIRLGLPADLVVLREPCAALPGDASPVRAVVAAGRLMVS
jgi:hypothetical protein